MRSHFVSHLATACALWVLSSGCTPTSTVPPAGKPEKPHSHAHGEGHEHEPGPHGGTLVDWGGGKYHVEFTVDRKKKEAVVYVLGMDEKTATPIVATDGKVLLTIKTPAFQLELKAQPLDGETDGKSSRYVGEHENLGGEQKFAGTISGEIAGTPYAGDFDEKPHGHDHKHEKPSK